MVEQHPALTPLQAGATVAGALGFTTWLASLHPPVPSSPETFRWYLSLRKPGWTPPGPVIGTIWSAIESGLAWGGYRLLRQPASARQRAAAGLWLFNVGMIGGWSELFFGGKKLGLSALASGAMLGTGAAYVAVARKVDPRAAATGAPLVAWLTVATLLATQVWRMNAGRSGRPA